MKLICWDGKEWRDGGHHGRHTMGKQAEAMHVDIVIHPAATPHNKNSLLLGHQDASFLTEEQTEDEGANFQPICG